MARDQVLDPSHGADHDLAAGPQLRLLAADRGAAEHGDDVDALALAVRAQRLRDLDAELARRRQHEPLDVVLRGIDVLEHRQPEGRRLARAGLRLPDHVEALEQRRDRLLLDRARRFVADVVDGGQEIGLEPRSANVVIGVDDRRRAVLRTDGSAAGARDSQGVHYAQATP